jgi:hypothetical protein
LPEHIVELDLQSPAFLYTNIGKLRNKVVNLDWEARQFKNAVAICLTETHLDSEITLGELKINGYQLLIEIYMVVEWQFM